MPGVILRGDLARLKIGKYVKIGENTILRPPLRFPREADGKVTYYAVSIGNCVTIGENCVIMASKIGDNVVIGANCIIGKRCIIRDNCQVLPGSVLAPDTTVAPYTIFGGFPGLLVGELPESAHITHKDAAKDFYRRFTGV
eukprot:GHVU01104810.1.p1 GENE.GHVU01104810.1~~GHVU01104810.1.p1  ORF type:complete len:141 (-),score=2.13 GHVU01104810.1:272-694(-)